MNLSTWFRVLAFLDREYPDDRSLSDRIDQARSYVDNHFYRAEVVSVLPVDAPGGYLMVKPGDVNLYVGAGPGNALRKIPTQPL